MLKKLASTIIALCLVGLTAVGCGNSEGGASEETTVQPTTEPKAIVTNLHKPDKANWRYNEDFGFYYQNGIAYCDNPVEESYERLDIFVPEEYMNATDNGDGTFTCEMNGDAKLNGYSALDAPIIMPVLTTGFKEEKAWTDSVMEELYGMAMSMASEFTSQGFVFIHPGCRGITEGVPTGVTDIKAAVRYVRYCDDTIAGDAESIFVFGMSGGGAQTAVLGASGDSELYTPYLKAVGAVEGVSDSVKGAMCWCPVTDLGTANAEYEWMMGCTRTGRSTEEQALSDSLAKAYADYVNKAGFRDENGNVLTLTESQEGIYQAGSYYDYIKGVIENSLNNFLSDTDFGSGTAEDYINSMNADRKWISYDKSTNTATVTSVADFCKECKNASELIVAFDQPDSQNTLFGYGYRKPSHFDRMLADSLAEIGSEYASDYADDLTKTDAFGNTVEQRVDMFSPLYYLMESRGGYGKSNVAEYWRIRTGIKQTTNSLTCEVNLALALKHYDGVKSVDFETVWDKDHTEAERTGDRSVNFAEWVNSCMK